MNDILKKLKSTQIFKNLHDNILASLAAIVKEEQYTAGQYIYRKGDIASSMYLVQGGEIELRKSFRRNPDKSKILTIIEEGDFFGDLAFFGDQNRHADAVARIDTVLLRLDYTDITSIVGSDPESARNILQMILTMLAPKIHYLIEELSVLVELGRLIPRMQDVEELTRVVFDLVIDVIETEDAGFLAVLNIFNEEFDVCQCSGDIKERHIEFDNPVVQSLLEHKEPIIVNNADQDDRFKNIAYLGRSFIASPVLYEDTLTGFILLVNTSRENAFNYSQMLLLKTVCAQMGEKLHDIERKREDLMKDRLDQAKLSADI